jgi:hypothetical protein
MAVETLVFCKKMGTWEIAIQYTYTVKFIERGQQVVLGISYSHQVPWGYIPGCAY